MMRERVWVRVATCRLDGSSQVEDQVLTMAAGRWGEGKVWVRGECEEGEWEWSGVEWSGVERLCLYKWPPSDGNACK